LLVAELVVRTARGIREGAYFLETRSALASFAHGAGHSAASAVGRVCRLVDARGATHRLSSRAGRSSTGIRLGQSVRCREGRFTARRCEDDDGERDVEPSPGRLLHEDSDGASGPALWREARAAADGDTTFLKRENSHEESIGR
jgi:hypothetical protein